MNKEIKSKTRKTTRAWPEGHRPCSHCDKMKPLECFLEWKNGARGRYPVCKVCQIEVRKKLLEDRPMENRILIRARDRATKRGLDFNLTIEDIRIPEICPVLGISLTLKSSVTLDSSPSIDRLNPKLGYVKGNVRIISNRANLLKNNGTLEEMRKIVADLEKISHHK